jgi:hypothetical protein
LHVLLHFTNFQRVFTATAIMPALGQMENATLMEVEHTPPVHKRMLDILPGVSGGVARIMVGQPFDTIKTRLQVLGKGTIGAAGMPADMVYTSGMDCVRKMVSLRLLVGSRSMPGQRHIAAASAGTALSGNASRCCQSV